MSTIRYLIQVSVNQASNIRWSIHVKTFSSWDCQADLTMQIIKSSQSFLDKFLIDKNLSVSFQFSIRCISDASSLCLRGYLNTLTLSPSLSDSFRWYQSIKWKWNTFNRYSCNYPCLIMWSRSSLISSYHWDLLVGRVGRS